MNFTTGSDDDKFDCIFKIVVIGDSGCGKTCIAQRFKTGNYINKHVSTIGVDFIMKTLIIEGKTVKLQIWDTAGQERFRTIVQSYYRKADGVILVYDITKRATFLNIQRWMEEVKKYTDPDAAIILIGNKCDKETLREVEFSEAEALCEIMPEIMMVLEVSAKDNTNIDGAFAQLAAELKSSADGSNLKVPSSTQLDYDSTNPYLSSSITSDRDSKTTFKPKLMQNSATVTDNYKTNIKKSILKGNTNVNVDIINDSRKNSKNLQNKKLALKRSSIALLGNGKNIDSDISDKDLCMPKDVSLLDSSNWETINAKITDRINQEIAGSSNKTQPTKTKKFAKIEYNSSSVVKKEGIKNENLDSNKTLKESNNFSNDRGSLSKIKDVPKDIVKNETCLNKPIVLNKKLSLRKKIEVVELIDNSTCDVENLSSMNDDVSILSKSDPTNLKSRKSLQPNIKTKIIHSPHKLGSIIVDESEDIKPCIDSLNNKINEQPMKITQTRKSTEDENIKNNIELPKNTGKFKLIRTKRPLKILADEDINKTSRRNDKIANINESNQDTQSELPEEIYNKKANLILNSGQKSKVPRSVITLKPDDSCTKPLLNGQSTKKQISSKSTPEVNPIKISKKSEIKSPKRKITKITFSDDDDDKAEVKKPIKSTITFETNLNQHKKQKVKITAPDVEKNKSKPPRKKIVFDLPPSPKPKIKPLSTPQFHPASSSRLAAEEITNKMGRDIFFGHQAQSHPPPPPKQEANRVPLHSAYIPHNVAPGPSEIRKNVTSISFNTPFGPGKISRTTEVIEISGPPLHGFGHQQLIAQPNSVQITNQSFQTITNNGGQQMFMQQSVAAQNPFGGAPVILQKSVNRQMVQDPITGNLIAKQVHRNVAVGQSRDGTPRVMEQNSSCGFVAPGNGFLY